MDQNGRMPSRLEVERFIQDGYLVLRSALPRELAEECRVSAAEQLGIDLAGPKMWRQPVVRGVPTGECFKQGERNPRDVPGSSSRRSAAMMRTVASLRDRHARPGP
jgi:hypothetical protein